MTVASNTGNLLNGEHGMSFAAVRDARNRIKRELRESAQVFTTGGADSGLKRSVSPNVGYLTYPLVRPRVAPFRTNEVRDCHRVIHNPEKPWEIFIHGL